MKKGLSILLVMVMVLGLLFLDSFAVSAEDTTVVDTGYNLINENEFATKIKELKTMYPEKSSPDYTYYEHGSALAWTCHGFANKLAYYCFGTSMYSYDGGYSKSWDSSYFNAGDIVRVDGDGHSIFITYVNGNTIRYAEGNHTNGKEGYYSAVRWDVETSLYALQERFTYKVHLNGNYLTGGGKQYIDLGADFYAMIANNYKWKAIGLDENQNMVVCPYLGYNDQIWHFIRQNNGGYKIINGFTDTYIVGDNIASLENEVGHNNKIWYIMQGEKGYRLVHYSGGQPRWLHPAYENWNEGTQITLDNAERDVNINILSGESNKPQRFDFITENKTLKTGSDIKMEWNKSKFGVMYNVEIWKDDSEHLLTTKTRNSSYTINNLETGYYVVYIYAENYLGQSPCSILHFYVANDYLGDTDGDGKVEIRDATWIQRRVATMDLPFTFNKPRTDVDGDGEITVMDATAIQRYLAQLPTPEGIGNPITNL